MKIWTISIYAKRKRKGSNTYHEGNIILNEGLGFQLGTTGLKEKIIPIPLTYGYGTQYEWTAHKLLNDHGIIDSDETLSRYCKDNNINFKSEAS